MADQASVAKSQSPTRRASRRDKSASAAVVALRSALTATPRGYLRSSSCSTSPAARRAGVYSSCCLKCTRPREDMASLDLVLLDADEVRCDAVAGHRGLDLFVVLLKSAHTGCRATWQQLQLIADRDRAIDQCAGDHRA